MLRPFTLALCLTALVFIPVTSSAADASVAEIWKQFEKRQSAAQTAHVKWERTYFLSADMMRFYLSRTAEAPANKETIEGLTHPSLPCELFLSNKRSGRYDHWGSSFTHGNRGTPYQSTTTFNNEGLYQSMISPAGKKSTASGVTKTSESSTISDAFEIVPLMWALRPLHPDSFGPSPKGWAIEDNPSLVDGRECVVLRRTRPTGAVDRVFLDAGRKYVPLRRETKYANGGESDLIVASYERQEAPAWIPSKWTTTSLNPDIGVLSETKTNHVEVELGIPVPESTFVIDYPEGAHVIDARNREKFFVVGAGGELIPNLLDQAQTTAEGSGNWLWISLAIGGAAIIGLALFLRKRQTAGGG